MRILTKKIYVNEIAHCQIATDESYAFSRAHSDTEFKGVERMWKMKAIMPKMRT